jgi:hypothetical protein
MSYLKIDVPNQSSRPTLRACLSVIPRTQGLGRTGPLILFDGLEKELVERSPSSGPFCCSAKSTNFDISPTPRPSYPPSLFRAQFSCPMYSLPIPTPHPRCDRPKYYSLHRKHHVKYVESLSLLSFTVCLRTHTTAGSGSLSTCAASHRMHKYPVVTPFSDIGYQVS